MSLKHHKNQKHHLFIISHTQNTIRLRPNESSWIPLPGWLVKLDQTLAAEMLIFFGDREEEENSNTNEKITASLLYEGSNIVSVDQPGNGCCLSEYENK